MDINALLSVPLEAWQAQSAPADDVVISSRVRLARNLTGSRFPYFAEQDELQAVEEKVKGALKALTKEEGEPPTYIGLGGLDGIDTQVLVEKHVVSPQFVAETAHRGLVVNRDASLAMMVNEEDHLRIQCMAGGFQLRSALAHAQAVDDALASELTFAFDDRWGYLTACPTNVGTGMRASLMIHVPALVRTKKIQRLIQNMMKLNFSVRGMYGEGSDIIGNVFQLSNQITLGMSESDIVAALQRVGEELIKEEREAREQLLAAEKDLLEDEIWRSYGVLRYARSMSGKEAMTRLSQVELGRVLGLLPQVPHAAFRELTVLTRPGFLQRYIRRPELPEAERDSWRAVVIRDKLQSYENSYAAHHQSVSK